MKAKIKNGEQNPNFGQSCTRTDIVIQQIQYPFPKFVKIHLSEIILKEKGRQNMMDVKLSNNNKKRQNKTCKTLKNVTNANN